MTGPFSGDSAILSAGWHCRLHYLRCVLCVILAYNSWPLLCRVACELPPVLGSQANDKIGQAIVPCRLSELRHRDAPVQIGLAVLDKTDIETLRAALTESRSGIDANVSAPDSPIKRQLGILFHRRTRIKVQNSSLHASTVILKPIIVKRRIQQFGNPKLNSRVGSCVVALVCLPVSLIPDGIAAKQQHRMEPTTCSIYANETIQNLC